MRRFVQRLGADAPLPFRRMECGPGEEAQVDFGTGAPVVTPDGKRRKTHVFRIVLSHSRKAYSEATFTQTTDDFFRCLENAFAHFGGVPKTLVIDNLKAAVAHPDWFDPELTPKVQSFCRHYGTVILPTKPYTPRHKGKVEAGVKYVKNNALQGPHVRQPGRAEPAPGATGKRTVADTRIHGTTKQQVGKRVRRSRASGAAAAAAGAVRLLPRSAAEGESRRPRRSGQGLLLGAAGVSGPRRSGCAGTRGWCGSSISASSRSPLHVRHEPGRFSTHGAASGAGEDQRPGTGRRLPAAARSALIGPQTQQWAEAMLTARGIEGTRVLQGLLALTKKHASEALEKACEIALSHGCYRLRTLRQLLKRQARQARAAAVPGRASAHSAAGRLRRRRRAGDPSPGRSLLRERRF